MDKNQHKLALINGKIIDYNTLTNIQINKNKDKYPEYKSVFNHEDDTNIDSSNFPMLIWDNHTYTKYLFYLNYILKYQEELFYQYNKALLVKDIPFIVYNQLKGFGKKINMDIVNKIFYNKQYLIFLLNSFGLVVFLLEDMEKNIYNNY